MKLYKKYKKRQEPDSNRRPRRDKMSGELSSTSFKSCGLTTLPPCLLWRQSRRVTYKGNASSFTTTKLFLGDTTRWMALTSDIGHQIQEMQYIQYVSVYSVNKKIYIICHRTTCHVSITEKRTAKKPTLIMGKKSR